MATPSESGTAMSSAMNDETSVPKIRGKAPNSSATGSQVLRGDEAEAELGDGQPLPVQSS